ncbi:hypothetical protein FIV00_03630 [Labrenzia sp. THAF82]|uniref:hypothetical protein n=1 Tax=Labrenzia sp. THAF82 TaxID=2587861 RepID=UPI0012696AB6|nr:hypothetical protein [Labrenzia sp. THAF82]QFT29560.1 hypothetical protein FIV00_03630 [Labrenzia sp. THAF82]
MFKKSLATVAMSVMLAACNSDLPNATEEQLLKLFGDREEMGITLISSHMIECLDLISDDAVRFYVDFSDETTSDFTTTCYKWLHERIEQADQNPMGYTMAHLEDPELGLLLKQLREKQDKLITELREQERAEIAERRRAENEERDRHNIEELEQAKAESPPPLRADPM